MEAQCTNWILHLKNRKSCENENYSGLNGCFTHFKELTLRWCIHLLLQMAALSKCSVYKAN